MPVMDNGVLILSLSSILVLKIKQIMPRRFYFVMLFLQTVLNYQNFMYPNISPCLSLLPLKTAATFASLKLSLLTRRGNRSKDPDRRGEVRTQNFQTY